MLTQENNGVETQGGFDFDAHCEPTCIEGVYIVSLETTAIGCIATMNFRLLEKEARELRDLLDECLTEIAEAKE